MNKPMGSLTQQLTKSIFFLIHFLPTILAYDGLKLWNKDCSSSSYTSGSTYDLNLNHSLSSILSNSKSTKGFFNISTGQDPNKASAIGLCRGDVNVTLCHNCLDHVIHELQKNCTMSKEAIGWEDWCMLRYSNRPIFGQMETSPFKTMCSPNNLSDLDVADFIAKRNKLLNELQNNATSGDPPSFLGDGMDSVTDNLEVYAMVQCTPDITGNACFNCLGSAIEEVPNSCNKNTGGGRIQMPSCNVRFEKDPFYYNFESGGSPSALSPPPASPPMPGKHHSNLEKVILIVVLAVAVVVASAIVIVVFYLRCLSQKQGKDEIVATESLQFDFRTIQVATCDFSDANKLGQGGFGAVYKGKISNGQEIAVKRLSQSSGQGETEFKNEASVLAKLQHRNLVRLLGFCLHEQERLLVYEYVSNGSLDHCLFHTSTSTSLDYETRFTIFQGIARGLLYLHEDSRLRVIHRDLKASNVLLATDMTPKISDFGLARLVQADEIYAQTNKVMGTIGYMAPEYVVHGKISVKLDVYSFGILVLEIVTGRRNNTFNTDEDDLISFVWKHWKEGKARDIIEAIEKTDASKTEMLRCLQIGLLCVQENEADRPTMSTVVFMLSGNTVAIPLPVPPSFLLHDMSSAMSSYQSTINATQQLNEQPEI